MQKNTWIIIGICIVAVTALFAWSWFSKNIVSDTADMGVVPSVSESDWTKGNPDASVVLIEYSDFECPACKAYYQPVKRLTKEYGDRVLFVYRHFPLTNIHRHALSAAFAAEAAGRQGRFFEMHDILFERQSDWAGEADAEKLFFAYAEELTLDVEQFGADTDNKTILDAIEASYRDGLRAGVNGTPTFFLNGERIENPRNYEAFQKIIDSALQGK